MVFITNLKHNTEIQVLFLENFTKMGQLCHDVCQTVSYICKFEAGHMLQESLGFRSFGTLFHQECH